MAAACQCECPGFAHSQCLSNTISLIFGSTHLTFLRVKEHQVCNLLSSGSEKKCSNMYRKGHKKCVKMFNVWEFV